MSTNCNVRIQMLFQSVLPKLENTHVIEFCEQISPGMKPIYVEVMQIEGMKSLECHPNVAGIVKKMGGKQVFGWEISEFPAVHLEARFHSILEANPERLLDITPEDSGQTQILFLRDLHLKYNGVKVTPMRFSLCEMEISSRLLALLEKLDELLCENRVCGPECPAIAMGRNPYIDHITKEIHLLVERAQSTVK